ncbi:MAG: hypothetical protein IT379_02530, partial [Deltaproteobacteria bacterium]|nr:hypothetical protein [Deltaproteobacteria bacterium]
VETSADGNVHGTFDPPDLGEGVTRVRLRLVLVGGAVLESPEVPLVATATTIEGHLDATGEAPVGLTNPARHYVVTGSWRVRGMHPTVEPLGSGGPFPFVAVGDGVPVRIELAATMVYAEADPPPSPSLGCDTACGATSGCVDATVFGPLELLVPTPRTSYPSVYELLAGAPAEMPMTVTTIPGGYAVDFTPPAGAQVSAGVAFRFVQTREHRCPDGRVARTMDWSQLVRTGAVVVRTP